ncbi:hypothetical protein MCOR02_001680 [Pyricularia oryzae]|nr:hypothetical protein MCOR02_001680 [Pyricularia oryzae]
MSDHYGQQQHSPMTAVSSSHGGSPAVTPPSSTFHTPRALLPVLLRLPCPKLPSGILISYPTLPAAAGSSARPTRLKLQLRREASVRRHSAERQSGSGTRIKLRWCLHAPWSRISRIALGMLRCFGL